MSHPYSNAAGYIYANEYEAPSGGRHSAEMSRYESFSPLRSQRLEVDPRSFDDQRNFDRTHVGLPGRKGDAAGAMRPGMTTISTTTTRTSSSFSPFSQASSLPTRTTSNTSHDHNPPLAVRYTPSKRVHAPYDPFAYRSGVYDTQDFRHINYPLEAKSRFSFKFKLTLPRAFRFRSRPPRSPISPWPPHSPTITTNKSLGCPLNVPRGITLYDDKDDDPSSSHWRWSSFEQRRPSSLTRWFSRTKSKTMKSVSGPSAYRPPLRNTFQEQSTLHPKSSSGNLHDATTRGRPTKGSLRFTQDAARDRLGPGTGRRAEKNLKFPMAVTST